MTEEFKIVAEGDVPSVAADPGKFAGDVRQAEILSTRRENGMRAHRFSYGAGARSNWHVHSGEQALVVVSGRGLVQWAGLEEPREVEPGDWIHVVPGVPHWHGATGDSDFVHLAITASGETEWGEPVAP
ncbi:cupin domain-containing protein [Actinoplanes sp. NPDC051861]|uniref:cupin domain-containing protein n=1 Tax=Actinoplanes sp. NPDC051861 TaxID=3155170 RepID=UPI0034345AE8